MAFTSEDALPVTIRVYVGEIPAEPIFTRCPGARLKGR
jgi:hypothetical protein